MLIGNRQQAVNAANATPARGSRLVPRCLNDGTYALPESAKTDSELSTAASGLAEWTVSTPSAGSYLPDPFTGSVPGLAVLIDGSPAYHAGTVGSVSMPDPNVFRFEIEPNDFIAVLDSVNQNRRAEFVRSSTVYVSGDVVWSAFSFVLGDHAGLSKVKVSHQGYVHQWHSTDQSLPRSPVLGVDCSNNQMTIVTRSSAETQANGNGVTKVHYTGALPAKGQINHVVLQITLGASGHINAWVDGSQVANTDIPVGYYAEDATLAYPHWGLYTRNEPSTEVVYIANPEVGTDSLSDRIGTPLEVPDLTW